MKPFFWLWGSSEPNIYFHKPSTVLAASFEWFTDEIPFFSRRFLGMLLLVDLHLSTLDPRINRIGSFENQSYNCCDLTDFSTLRYLQPFCVAQPWSTLYTTPGAEIQIYWRYHLLPKQKDSITIIFRNGWNLPLQLLIVKILMKTVVRSNTRTNRI